MLSICTKRFVRSAIGVSSIVAAFNHLVKNNSLGISLPLDIIKPTCLPKEMLFEARLVVDPLEPFKDWLENLGTEKVFVVIQFCLNVGF